MLVEGVLDLLEDVTFVAELQPSSVREHVLEPEGEEAVVQAVQAKAALVGGLLGNRDLLLDESQGPQEVEVAGEMGLVESSVVDDLGELPLSLGDRPEDDVVVPWFAELFPKEELHLVVKVGIPGEDQLGDVSEDALVRSDVLQVGRDRSEGRVYTR